MKFFVQLSNVRDKIRVIVGKIECHACFLEMCSSSYPASTIWINNHILYGEQRDKSEFGARDWIKKMIPSSLAEDRMATALSWSRHLTLSQFRPSPALLSCLWTSFQLTPIA